MPVPGAGRAEGRPASAIKQRLSGRAERPGSWSTMTSLSLVWGLTLVLVLGLGCSSSHSVAAGTVESELCRPVALLECEARRECRCTSFDFDDCVARSTELCVRARE